MTIEQLKKQHDLITQQFYVEKILSKEEFERLHLENSIAQKEIIGEI